MLGCVDSLDLHSHGVHTFEIPRHSVVSNANLISAISITKRLSEGWTRWGAYIAPSDHIAEFQGKAMKESSAVKKWEGGRGKVTEN